MSAMKTIALSAIAGAALASSSISFANHQDPTTWADSITLSSGGTVSNVSFTGGIEASTDINNQSVVIAPKGYISTLTGSTWDGWDLDMSDHLSSDVGTVSLTVTSSDGQTCDITIESGGSMNEAELLQSTCDAQLSTSEGGNTFWNAGLSTYTLSL